MSATSAFVGEIAVFGFTFAPKGWAQCNGQIMLISQNTALFSLLGTVYGGDGKTTFGLPNLKGSFPMHPGQGPGLSLHDLGEVGGSELVGLLESEVPTHTHTLQGTTGVASSNDGSAMVVARPFGGGSLYQVGGTPTTLAPTAMTATGGSAAHNNLQPYLVLNFCIALQGIYPARWP